MVTCISLCLAGALSCGPHLESHSNSLTPHVCSTHPVVTHRVVDWSVPTQFSSNEELTCRSAMGFVFSH